MSDVALLSWPLARVGEVLEAFSRRFGLPPEPVELPAPPDPLGDREGSFGRWMDASAERLGLEAEAVESHYGEVESALRRAGPALLLLREGDEARFVPLVRAGRRRVAVLGPDLRLHRLRPDALSSIIHREIEKPVAAEVERLLAESGSTSARRERVRRAILKEWLANVRIAGLWILRLPPRSDPGRLFRDAKLHRRLLALLFTHALQHGLWIVSWWIIGRGVLQGRFESAWFWAWVLVLLSLIPIRLLSSWMQGTLALGAGALLKQRLLHGALKLPPDEIRREGAGQILGRVIESEAVESLALSGGFLGAMALIELVMAAAVLAAGAGGALQATLLCAFAVITAGVAGVYLRDRRRWTEARLRMTHDLVERLVGHRTRLAQQPRERWHDGEDEALERYAGESSTLDRTGARLMAILPRSWQVVALAALAPAFVSGDSTPALLAVALGGVLLASQALSKLAAGATHLAGAAIAWIQVRSLFHAASAPEVIGSPAAALAPGAGSRRPARPAPLIEAQGLTFRYPGRGEPVLRSCSATIEEGDRVLVEGPSGAGKSTLTALLSGLRQPDSGLLLFRGLDRETLGDAGWRRFVVAAPQFHENHVLTGTLAFNLLMGRRWPPDPQDLEDAETLCRDLGLGPLLDRMPSGLLQIVGETGWQLSHGEQSRLFIARAILQRAELVILDESFAALDPETLRRALRCVLERVPTLLVVAHP